jgi:hypothetical protein
VHSHRRAPSPPVSKPKTLDIAKGSAGARQKRQEPGRNRLRSFCNEEHDAEKWVPVSRLREARGRVRRLA